MFTLTRTDRSGAIPQEAVAEFAKTVHRLVSETPAGSRQYLPLTIIDEVPPLMSPALADDILFLNELRPFEPEPTPDHVKLRGLRACTVQSLVSRQIATLLAGSRGAKQMTYLVVSGDPARTARAIAEDFRSIA